MNLNEDLPSVKILVVGDSGAGKTSLVYALCKEEPAGPKHGATTGCSISIKVQEHVTYNATHPHFVEFWDVGGNASYALSRHVFYSGAKGILLVYDMSNSRSYRNLQRWISELKAYYAQNTPGSSADLNSSGRIFGIPALIVGTKSDLYQSSKKRPNPLEEFRIEYVEVVACLGAQRKIAAESEGKRLSAVQNKYLKDLTATTIALGQSSRNIKDRDEYQINLFLDKVISEAFSQSHGFHSNPNAGLFQRRISDDRHRWQWDNGQIMDDQEGGSQPKYGGISLSRNSSAMDVLPLTMPKGLAGKHQSGAAPGNILHSWAVRWWGKKD